MSADMHGRNVTDDAFYEWLLSDHPAAKAERDSRRAATYQAETDRAAAVRAWADKINAQPDAPQTLRDLAASMGPLADQTTARAQASYAEPDDAYVTRPAPSTKPNASLRPARLLGLPLPRPPDRSRRRRLSAATRTRRPRTRTGGRRMTRHESERRPPVSEASLPRGPGLFAIDRSDGTFITNIRRLAGRDRPPGSVLIMSATWLLAILDAGLLYVSFDAQYRYIFAVKNARVPAMIEAAMLDAGMIILSALGIGLAMRGKASKAERFLIMICAAASTAMNFAAADPGSWRSVVAYTAVPPPSPARSRSPPPPPPADQTNLTTTTRPGRRGRPTRRPERR